MNIITEIVAINNMQEIHYCYSCGAEAEGCCRTCEQPVCDKCTVPFTQFNQIDYDLCNDCDAMHQEERAEELYEDSLTPTQLVKYRKEKSLMSSLVRAIKKRFGK